MAEEAELPKGPFKPWDDAAPTTTPEPWNQSACQLVPPCKQGNHGVYYFDGVLQVPKAIGKYHFTELALKHDVAALQKGVVYEKADFYKRAKAWYKAEIDRLLHRQRVREEEIEEQQDHLRGIKRGSMGETAAKLGIVLEEKGQDQQQKPQEKEKRKKEENEEEKEKEKVRVKDNEKEKREKEDKAKEKEEEKHGQKVKEKQEPPVNSTTGSQKMKKKEKPAQAPTRVQPARAAKRKATEQQQQQAAPKQAAAAAAAKKKQKTTKEAPPPDEASPTPTPSEPKPPPPTEPALSVAVAIMTDASPARAPQTANPGQTPAQDSNENTNKNNTTNTQPPPAATESAAATRTATATTTTATTTQPLLGETRGDYVLAEHDWTQFQNGNAGEHSGALAYVRLAGLDVAYFVMRVEQVVREAVFEAALAAAAAAASESEFDDGDEDEEERWGRGLYSDGESVKERRRETTKSFRVGGRFEPAAALSPGEDWRPPVSSSTTTATMTIDATLSPVGGETSALAAPTATTQPSLSPAPTGANTTRDSSVEPERRADADMDLSPTLGRWPLKGAPVDVAAQGRAARVVTLSVAELARGVVAVSGLTFAVDVGLGADASVDSSRGDEGERRVRFFML